MGKRSDFARVENDFYPTPPEAIPFLRPFLPRRFTFCEPCAGDGQLVRLIERIGGDCLAQYDIEPRHPLVQFGRAHNMLSQHLRGAEFIITNPPWTRDILHQLILRFSRLAVPCWCLWDANWMFTDQGAMFMDWRRGQNRIHKIVAVGRLTWIPGTDETGKDDAAWFLVGPPVSAPPAFYPRF